MAESPNNPETDLIERYIQEFGTYLPKDLHDEATAELRSKLQGSLQQLQEDPAQDPGQDPRIKVLTDLGPPHLLADGYVPRPRVLFGPRLYPPFFRTLKIAIAILVVLSAMGVYLDFASTPSLLSLGPAIFAFFSRILTGSLLILGISVLVFAMLERTAAAPAETETTWDPMTLPEAGDPDKVSLGDRVSNIAFLVVALIVVNLFRDRIGAHVTWEDGTGWVPLLGSAFESWLWLLNLTLALDLAVNVIVLARWRWSWTLRWANLVVNGLYVIWLGLLVSQPPLIAPDPDWMLREGWSPEAVAKYQDFVTEHFALWADRALRWGFWAACAGLVFSFGRLVWRLLSRT